MRQTPLPVFASLLTTFFFAVSAMVGRRSTHHLGSQRANLARQLVALGLLALWAHTLGQGLHGPALGIMVVSGVIGFGFGDWALFEALPRIGPGLTILLCQCLAAPIAAVTERLWLGTILTGWQMASAAVILVGVALAVTPGRDDSIPAGHRLAGILWALGAAAGQAWGAVVSRYAFQQSAAAGFSVDGITAAYQRLWGGALCIVALLLLRRLVASWFAHKSTPIIPDWRGGWPWVVANAFAGPTIGVSCYQWALKTTSSAIVLQIVATTPLVVMILAFAFEGTRPTCRAIVGSLLAVAGVVTLVINS